MFYMERYCIKNRRCRGKPLNFVIQRDLVVDTLTDREIALCSCGEMYRRTAGQDSVEIWDGKRFVPYDN